ncbi:MAG: hypothetical protein PWQ24_1192 [Mesotoga sp.]|nr:hypothetical protein [Mesotoga sp.]
MARTMLVLLAVLMLFTSAFALIEAEPLSINTSGVDRMPWVFEDTIYFVTQSYNIYQATWNDGNCGEPEPVKGAVNSSENEISPCVLRNNIGELVMYFGRYTGSDRDYDFFRSVFDEGKGEWGEPEVLLELSTEIQDWKIWVNGDETKAYVTTKGAFGGIEPTGVRDIWVSEKENGKWSTPTKVDEVNSSGNEWSVFVDPDGKIWFDSSRDDSIGGYDIYFYDPSTGEIGHPEMMINSFYDERSLWTDGKIIVFSTVDRPNGVGGYDIFMAELE